MTPLPPSRLARHLHTLGILWVAFAIYSALRWLLVLPILHLYLGGRTPWMPEAPTWAYGPFHPGGRLLHVITVLVLVRALLSLAAGIALLTRQPWGRVFAIVMAILTLVKPLFGTILAIYSLWVLLSCNAGMEYDRIALAERTTPLYPGTSPPRV